MQILKISSHYTYASSQAHVFKTSISNQVHQDEKLLHQGILFAVYPKASCMYISSGIITSVDSSWSNNFSRDLLQWQFYKDIMAGFPQPSSSQITEFIMSQKNQSSMTTNHTMVYTVTGLSVTRHILYTTTSYSVNTMDL